MKKVTLNCSICKEKIDEQIIKNTNKVYWTEGHNAEPINDGRCCTSCNNAVVMPYRILKSVMPKLDDINNSLTKALYSAEHDSEEELDEWLRECVKVSKSALAMVSQLKLNRDKESNATHLIPLESIGMFINASSGITYPMLADGINADLYEGVATHVEDLEVGWLDDLDVKDFNTVKDIMRNLEEAV